MSFHLVIFKKRFPAIYQTIKHKNLNISTLQDNSHMHFCYKIPFLYLSQYHLHSFVTYLSNQFKVKGYATEKH